MQMLLLPQNRLRTKLIWGVPTEVRKGFGYGADLQQMPEMDMQSYNDHLMMMDGINMNKTRVEEQVMSLKVSAAGLRGGKSHEK